MLVMKRALFFLCLSWVISGCQSQKTEKLTIATAANMQFAMESLIKAFTSETGIACETAISSSGKLTAQIEEGAPFDVFVSADMKYPARLFENGFSTAEPKIYAYGNLVLWSRVDGIEPSIELLSDEQIHHVALANPKTAPYGVAAIEVLTHFQLLDALAQKLVYGESISQTNQFIISKAAEIGFTAKSVVRSPQMMGKGQWKDIDPSIYAPIAQGVVIVKHSEKDMPAARTFYDFLFSEKARQILTDFGYAVGEEISQE